MPVYCGDCQGPILPADPRSVIVAPYCNRCRPGSILPIADYEAFQRGAATFSEASQPRRLVARSVRPPAYVAPAPTPQEIAHDGMRALELDDRRSEDPAPPPSRPLDLD